MVLEHIKSNKFRILGMAALIVVLSAGTVQAESIDFNSMINEVEQGLVISNQEMKDTKLKKKKSPEEIERLKSEESTEKRLSGFKAEVSF